MPQCYAKVGICDMMLPIFQALDIGDFDQIFF